MEEDPDREAALGQTLYWFPSEYLMTLLVAGSDGEQAWMVADTAITDPKVGVRERLRDVKIEPLQASLVGFSDNPVHARRVIATAREVPVGAQALEKLALGRKDYPRIDLAYAFWDGRHAQLHKLKGSNSKPEKVTALYLGKKTWFERFQRMKHSKKIDHASNAMHTLFVGGKSRSKIPAALFDAIFTMLRIFPMVSDREVGGGPIPYVLNRDGAFLVQYGYSVTDPILDRLRPGSPIPLGTAEGGGFGFSLTELGNGDGFVAYWLQKPGGYVFVRDPQGGGTEERFDGPPAEFIDKVDKKLGRRIELMFGDKPTANLDPRRVLTDTAGRDRVRIEGDGRTLVFRWIQSTADSWRARAENIDLDGHRSGEDKQISPRKP